MNATTMRTAGRLAGGALLAALCSAVAFHAWLGWGDVPRLHPDPLTGSTGGTSSGWRFAGFLVTLAVLTVVTAWRRSPWLPIVVLPPAVLVTASASTIGEDPLWTIAVAFLTLYLLLGTGAFSVLAVLARTAHRRTGSAPSA